jgi:methyltransferase family protein
MAKLLRKWLLRSLEIVLFRGRTGIDNADEALRYLPISDYILNGDLKQPKILEVGSGVKGITPYIPFKITGVDVSFNGEIAENLEPVCLSGARLPFPDNSFDYVISVDMLEHVPENERLDVITELLRVASKRVFLAVPCGKLAEAHDRFLDELYQQVKGERYHFFQEHVDNGLPVKEDLVACIKASAEKLGVRADIQVIGNVSLKVRTFFMRTWMSAKSAKLYTWVSPFICIFRRFLNSGECYRQIFVVDIMRGDRG